MSREQYRRAERCFSVARSTTFDGERDAAIARGTAIAEKAGLSLDLFDIPGRQAVRRAPAHNPLFEGNGIFGPGGYRYATDQEKREREQEVFESAIEEFFGGDGASFAEAFRNLNEALNRQTDSMTRERQRRQREENRLRDALNFLWARGVRIHPNEDGGYFSEDHHDPAAVFSQADVMTAAQSRGWKG